MFQGSKFQVGAQDRYARADFSRLANGSRRCALLPYTHCNLRKKPGQNFENISERGVREVV
jgi:hypothetical protein